MSLARARASDTILHQVRRPGPAVREPAQAPITVATPPGWARGHGWAMVVQDQQPAGLGQIRPGLATSPATGAAWHRPHVLAMLAEAAGRLGQPEAGRAALAEALVLVEQTGERDAAAARHRRRGALLRRHADPSPPAPGRGPPEDAEACVHHALDVARRQEATSLERRAAMSRARLWQQQGTRAEAHARLAPLDGWCTAGCDTADLQEATTLLEACVERNASGHARASRPSWMCLFSTPGV